MREFKGGRRHSSTNNKRRSHGPRRRPFCSFRPSPQRYDPAPVTTPPNPARSPSTILYRCTGKRESDPASHGRGCSSLLPSHWNCLYYNHEDHSWMIPCLSSCLRAASELPRQCLATFAPAPVYTYDQATPRLQHSTPYAYTRMHQVRLRPVGVPNRLPASFQPS